MSGKEAVIFDFDGVLVNSEVIALAELRNCLAEFGIALEMDKMISNFLGASFENIEAFVRQETGVKPKASFRENWYARLFDRYARELSVMPGALDLLDELDARNVRYCIASGGSYRRLNFALEVTQLDERFADRAFSADSVARGKPEPDLFLFAVERLGTSPQHCLVVEDAVAGVHAAARAGIDSLAFVGGDHLANFRDVHMARLQEAGAISILEDLGQTLQFVRPPNDGGV